MVFFKKCLLLCFVIIANSENLNDRPIVGILAQETSGDLKQYGASYITASYVKWVESAGARVVPVFIGKPKYYYEDLFQNINGVIFPGGNVNFSTSAYGRSGRYFHNLAKDANKNGDHFPIWGTCLGFELLLALTAETEAMLQNCKAQDLTTNLKFVPQFYKNSTLISGLSEDVKMFLKKLPVTANYHDWCVSEGNFYDFKLDKEYKILSLSKDRQNLSYVSIIEGRDFPFYGTAWHPEMNQFEFVIVNGQKNIPLHQKLLELVKRFQISSFLK